MIFNNSDSVQYLSLHSKSELTTDWFRAFKNQTRKSNGFPKLALPIPSQKILETYWHTDEKLQRLHDEFIENAVSNFYLPMAVAQTL